MKQNKEFNKYIIENLKNIAFSKSLDITSISKGKNYDSKTTSKEFYNTTIRDLNYKKSNTFFTNKFEKDITTILNSSEQFNRMTLAEKTKIQEQLTNFCQKEFEWKTYNKRIIRSTEVEQIPPYFQKEFEQFSEKAYLYLHPN
jgi:hypothetical protein